MPAGGEPGGVPRALAPLLDDPGRSGVLSDFDGTLAPIVDDPRQARPLPGLVAALGDLAGRVARVAVISGRPARFLVEHLGGPPGSAEISVWGLYGMERVEAGAVVPADEAEPWRAVVAAAAARARRELVPEVTVEDKGLTLTLHFRTAPGAAAQVGAWAAAVSAVTDLVVQPARMSVELRPPVPHGKGGVVEQASRDLRAVCFLGDDHGDLDGFDALDRLAGRGVAVARVAVRSEESPAELLARADVVVDGPAGVLELLEGLRRAVS